MTRTRAKELLPIIQAYAEGKAIQFRTLNQINDKWCEQNEEKYGYVNNINFNDSLLEFRIKPEPREFWITTHNGKAGNSYDDKPTVLGMAEGKYEIIKVREVLDEH